MGGGLVLKSRVRAWHAMAAAMLLSSQLAVAPAAADQTAACHENLETVRKWMRGAVPPLEPDELSKIDAQVGVTKAACDKALEVSGRDPTVLLDAAYAAIAAKDIKRAVKLVAEASDAGFPPAQVTYARFLGKGEYVDRNAEEAWLLLLQVLKSKNDAARMQAAMEFLPGGVGPENAAKTHAVFKELIDAGSAEAMTTYAMKVLSITKGGTSTEDVAAGLALLERAAAEKGDTAAMIYLSLLNTQGDVVPKDLEKARSYADKAVAAGNIAGLGTLAQIAQASGRDAEAVTLFRKGAEAGDGFSQAMLGFLLSAGVGVEQDMQEAEKWWTAGRWNGNQLAASYLRVHREHQRMTEEPAKPKP